ncbi:MAG: ExbD/TolR family protein [Akkermansiaceae bacterium]
MKLKMSIPERPGWIFAIPGFDFVALLLALVTLTGVTAKEGLVEVKLSSSSSRGVRGVRLGDENPVVVMLKSSSGKARYFVDQTEVVEADLGEVILDEARARETRAVVIRADREASMEQRQVLLNIIARLKGLRIFDVYRRVAEEEEQPQE